MNSPSPKTPTYTLANWQRAMKGVPAHATVEAMLFTDTWVTGEIPQLGPYAFLNTIASSHPSRALRPAVVMGVTHHYEPATGPAYRRPMENDFDHYHGGDYLDEMAALASLFIGIRLKAGQVNREFRAEGDPLGRPTHFGSKPDPQLVLEARPQIPRLALPAN